MAKQDKNDLMLTPQDKRGYIVDSLIISEDQLEDAYEMYANGEPNSEIASYLGLSAYHVKNIIKERDWENRYNEEANQLLKKETERKQDDIVQERLKTHERHKQLVRGIQSEMFKEVKPKIDSVTGKKVARTPAEEELRYVRLKSLQIAYNIAQGTIKLERELLGMDRAEVEQYQLPTDFKWTVVYQEKSHEMGNHATFNEISPALPQQDPHNYVDEEDEDDLSSDEFTIDLIKKSNEDKKELAAPVVVEDTNGIPKRQAKKEDSIYISPYLSGGA